MTTNMMMGAHISILLYTTFLHLCFSASAGGISGVDIAKGAAVSILHTSPGLVDEVASLKLTACNVSTCLVHVT
jgi:hypothetical protein